MSKTRLGTTHWIQIGRLFLASFLMLFVALGYAEAQGPVSGNNTTPIAPKDPRFAMPTVGLKPGLTGITTASAIPNSQSYDFASNADLSTPTTFPGGTFSGGGSIRIVGTDWSSWNPPTAGKHVVYVAGGSIDINFNTPQGGAGAKVQPNDFGAHSIAIEAFDVGSNSMGSFTVLNIIGNGGATFLGITSISNNITRIRITSDSTSNGFAFSDLTYGFNAPPEVPEGDTLLLVGGGLGGLITWLGWQFTKMRSGKHRVRR